MVKVSGTACETETLGPIETEAGDQLCEALDAETFFGPRPVDEWGVADTVKIEGFTKDEAFYFMANMLERCACWWLDFSMEEVNGLFTVEFRYDHS